EAAHRFTRIGDFDDEFFEAFVLQGDGDRLLRMSHVPEDEFAVVVKGAGREQSRHISSKNLHAVPPAPDRFGIVLDGDHVGDRQFQAAAKGPQLVHAVDREDNPIAFDRHVDHFTLPARAYRSHDAFRGHPPSALRLVGWADYTDAAL